MAAACAARGASVPVTQELGAAAALLRDGCYTCLQRALSTYERLAAGPRPPLEAQRGAFDAALLLAVRAKELGLPPEPFFERARSHASGLSSAAVRELTPSQYLEAADLFVGEVSGFDPEVRSERSQRLRRPADAPRPPARVALNAAAPSDLVADYLALAIDCEDARWRRDIDAAEVLARHGDAGLIRFRLALCALGTTPARVREPDPRWVDSLFFEGRAEMTRRPIADVAKAETLLRDARAAFPESNAIVLALGGARNALSEYQAALADYDSVLAREPSHRDALLGRVMSLSYLERFPEAIAGATQIIDLGTWLMGDAYYWRAWNRFQLKELDPAWADVEQATKLNIQTSTFTLAGFIAYARKDLDTAIDRFDRAFTLDKTNCEAIWAGALVHVDQQGWAPAAAKFSAAMSCFSTAVATARSDIDAIEKSNAVESVKAQRLAATQKRLETARFRGAQSAFNASQSYLRLGQKALALSHADAAAEHEQLREKALALRTTIEKLP